MTDPSIEVLADVGIAAYRLGPDGRVLDANSEVSRWTGRPREDIVGRDLAEVAPEGWGDDVLTTLAHFADTAGVRLIHGDRAYGAEPGPAQRLRFHAAPIRRSDGTLDHVVVTVMDLGMPGIVQVSAPHGPHRVAATRLCERHGLGPRHCELLELLATGHRVPKIAEMLHLARGTVRNRISALGDVLGARGQVEILALVQAEVDAQDPLNTSSR